MKIFIRSKTCELNHCLCSLAVSEHITQAEQKVSSGGLWTQFSIVRCSSVKAKVAWVNNTLTVLTHFQILPWLTILLSSIGIHWARLGPLAHWASVPWHPHETEQTSSIFSVHYTATVVVLRALAVALHFFFFFFLSPNKHFLGAEHSDIKADWGRAETVREYPWAWLWREIQHALTSSVSKNKHKHKKKQHSEPCSRTGRAHAKTCQSHYWVILVIDTSIRQCNSI